MSKKKHDDSSKKTSIPAIEVDPTECPFREFRDNELYPELWGVGPAAFRTQVLYLKSVPKLPHDFVWTDEQTQPLPRSVRNYLDGWVRAEDLAERRWNSEVLIFEDDASKMSIADYQLTHTQVLLRSSFCRRVMSACYILERIDSLIVEHQWDGFVYNFPPEGWRAKCHIYSPGLKPGGGQPHKPTISRSGCYLVRLYYLGSWRCVWVNDQVPVDASEAPLLPFSPLTTTAPRQGKHAPSTVTANVVYLWPLLICKALLKLAAPDMNSDEEDLQCMEDELMPDFDIMHSLTGGMNVKYIIPDPDDLWQLIVSRVTVFSWDDDDDTMASTLKSRSTKKASNRDTSLIRRDNMAYVELLDTKLLPPYHLPGITPGYEMSLLITVARDVPLKKPLPEPDVAAWKQYRWVDWSRRHGLYENYDCPRTQFLKMTGLMKLSYSPHLLDVQSTESITTKFIQEHKSNVKVKEKEKTKDTNKSVMIDANKQMQQSKEELREWIKFVPLQPLIKSTHVVYYPSMFQFSTSAIRPSTKVCKISNRALDIQASKCAPMYFQIDGPDINTLWISLNILGSRILSNSGILVEEPVEAGHLVLEVFEWFKDTDVSKPKAFIRTRGYNAVEMKFPPGRHICRIWVHSQLNWHIGALSESTILLGARDTIMCAAVKESHWAAKFLIGLGSAFNSWLKLNRSTTSFIGSDREFFKSYHPDLPWDEEVVGYDRAFLHWMFRQALQSVLEKKLAQTEFKTVCHVLRKYFCDPDFGMPKKPRLTKPARKIAEEDICDCVMPELEEIEEQSETEQVGTEDKTVLSESTFKPLPDIMTLAHVCDIETEETCAQLKEQRDELVRKHEAALCIQSHWRGNWARHCLNRHVVVTPEIIKYLNEAAFGQLDVLSNLMNEFFGMFPQAKTAYSVGSALCGSTHLQQHTGSTYVSSHCTWIPYFQGVFYCHKFVKVHIDLVGTIQHSTVAVFDNDTGLQLPQVYNAHKTFDIGPNTSGYTVMGHGSFHHAGPDHEATWQLTILSSIDGALHVCDNQIPCTISNLPQATKLRLEEIYLPNVKHILGGIQISVMKQEAVSFRAAATSVDLEMKATLKTTDASGQVSIVATCGGTGEIYWPYIRLQPASIDSKYLLDTFSQRETNSARLSTKPKASRPMSSKSRSSTKLKTPTGPKQYTIEIVAVNGWPLTIAQWQRVNEVQNTFFDPAKTEPPQKKTGKEKLTPSSSKRDREKEMMKGIQPLFGYGAPKPGDAYVEIECSMVVGVGAIAKRDDERDLELTRALKSWDTKEPGRNLRGAAIRNKFREEFLEVPPPEPTETASFIGEGFSEEIFLDEKTDDQQGPTPMTESVNVLEEEVEMEEESLYLLMPDQLRDKFVTLDFLPICTKEKLDEPEAIINPQLAEMYKSARLERIEAADRRMRELQRYNELFVLERQKNREHLLEKLFIDGIWCAELQHSLEQRDEAIANEYLNMQASANKKKQDSKKSGK